MRNERKSRKFILAYQLNRLRYLVSHAYQNVPFYKHLFDQAGVKPTDIQTINDLKYFPTISKKDYHTENISSYLDKNSQIELLKSIKTSGSSGLSLEFFVDHEYNQFRKAQYLRPYLTNGRKITDHVLRFCSESGVQQSLIQKIGILKETFCYANSNTLRQIELINKIRPKIIQGYGSELGLIAQEIIDQKIEISKPKLVFTDSEMLSLGTRNLIRKAFSADVIDVYGTYEAGNIAYECKEHSGYHVAEDCVLIEFLDQDQNPLPPGEKGELTFTILNNLTMPFIRYRIGDIGSCNLKQCSCGRTFLLMNNLSGRLVDFAICDDGSLKSPTAFIGVFDALADQIREFQVRQININEFEVCVVPKNKFSLELQNSIKSALHVEFPKATILVKHVNRIERGAAGKFKSFVQDYANVSNEHAYTETI